MKKTQKQRSEIIGIKSYILLICLILNGSCTSISYVSGLPEPSAYPKPEILCIKYFGVSGDNELQKQSHKNIAINLLNRRGYVVSNLCKDSDNQVAINVYLDRTQLIQYEEAKTIWNISSAASLAFIPYFTEGPSRVTVTNASGDILIDESYNVLTLSSWWLLPLKPFTEYVQPFRYPYKPTKITPIFFPWIPVPGSK